MNLMTPHEARLILNVDEDSTLYEIKQAHAAMLRFVHPDRVAGAPESVQRQATATTQRANEALGVLTAEAARRRSGSSGRAGAEGGSGGASTGPSSARPGRQAEAPPRSKPTPDPPSPPPGDPLTCLRCQATQYVLPQIDVYACVACGSPLFRRRCGCGRNVNVWGVGQWQCTCGRAHSDRSVVAR